MRKKVRNVLLSENVYSSDRKGLTEKIVITGVPFETAKEGISFLLEMVQIHYPQLKQSIEMFRLKMLEMDLKEYCLRVHIAVIHKRQLRHAQT